MKARAVVASLGAALALAAAGSVGAQGTTKKELVQRVLQSQQGELEGVSRSIVERPAAQMMQEAGPAIQRQVAADKREATGKAVEAEVKRYVEEAYPLVRERAVRLAPSTIGTVLEERMTEDELKQLVAWLESPANRKYQSLGLDMRNAFLQKLLGEVGPLLDPKVQELGGRVRALLGLPPASAAPTSGTAGPRPGLPAASRAAPK